MNPQSFQFSELAARASTLYERASDGAHLSQADVLRACFDDRARAALRGWQQAFAPGDPEAFARRLTWDGFDVGRALLSVAPITPARISRELAPWTEWLPRITAAVEEAPRELLASCAADLGACGLPFHEILAPVVVAARLEWVRRFGPPPAEIVTASALADLERRLAWELSFFAERALFELFAADCPQRVQRVSNSSAHYDGFVQQLLADRLAPLFETFPVLARQWAIVADGWVSASAEMIERLSRDRADIVSMICAACDSTRDPAAAGSPARDNTSDPASAGSAVSASGPVTAIKSGLSDPHHGRRRVAILVFASGDQVVYKPRSLAFDAAYQQLLGWFASRGLDPAPRALAVLDRESYGWIECVSSGEFASHEEVGRYYRQAGALLAIAWVLGGRDLHMENVVATRGGPVLVDLEMFLGPVRSGPRADISESSGQQDHGRLDQSVLASGLLSLYETTEGGQCYDIGGLQGGRRHATIRARRWTGLGTDALACVDGTVERTASNVVMLAGAPQSPSDYAEAVVAGFDAACSIAVEHGTALADRDGPLEPFSRCSTRFLLRPTEQYGRLLALLATPKYQRDGAAASAAWDAMLRGYGRARARPVVWPLVEAERAALAGLDVPHFDVPCAGTTVGTAGVPLMPQPYAQSGFDAARLRIGRLPSTRQRECSRLRMALRQTPAARFHTRLQEAGHNEFETAGAEVPAHENRRDACVAAAEWIGREMLARSDEERPAAARPDLYAGSAGPTLAYSALAVVTGKAEWRSAACAAIAATIDSSCDDREFALGICSGPLSTAYALLVAGALADVPEACDAAVRLASGLTFEHVMADPYLDVAAGSAGALLALAALSEATHDERWLTAARWCGERLERAAVREGDRISWPAADGRRYIGFAHGAAGIAHALLRLHALTGDPRWSELWEGAIAFERTGFADGNWLITDPASDSGPSGVPMIAWCHGAAGVVLARAQAVQLGRPSVASELGDGLRAIARMPAQRADHLCCGNFGRVEALFSAGRLLGAQPIVDAAFELACDRLRVARDRGHFRLSASPYEYRVFDPGFFHGLSGIAWQLLRLAAPETIPSVMTFDLPVSSPV